MRDEKRFFLTRLFETAIEAADPYHLLKKHFPRAKPKGRTLLIGLGKASIQMTNAFARLWQDAGFGNLDGFVVTRYGQVKENCLPQFELVQASHPLPDENSLKAADKIMSAVKTLGKEDMLIALVSGGGSALVGYPAAGLTLADKITLNQVLLSSGAPIQAMNAIRKQFSRVKGGKLAQMAHPAQVITYIVSDVPGDDPALISSGPTIADATSPDTALAFIRHYNIKLPRRLEDYFTHLSQAKQNLPCLYNLREFARDEVHLVASNRISLQAAQKQARSEGIEAVILSDAIEGEARDIALMHAALAREISFHDEPFRKPVVLLSGGETTVTFNPFSKNLDETEVCGGRNGEFALSLAIALAGIDDVTALAADTDGIDGLSQSAGAFCDGITMEKMRLLGFDPLAMLRRHNSAHVFAALGDLFTTGATGTNVNDFRAILIA